MAPTRDILLDNKTVVQRPALLDNSGEEVIYAVLRANATARLDVASPIALYDALVAHTNPDKDAEDLCRARSTGRLRYATIEANDSSYDVLEWRRILHARAAPIELVYTDSAAGRTPYMCCAGMGHSGGDFHFYGADCPRRGAAYRFVPNYALRSSRRAKRKLHYNAVDAVLALRKRHKRVLLIGDSTGDQWFGAFICALHHTLQALNMASTWFTHHRVANIIADSPDFILPSGKNLRPGFYRGPQTINEFVFGGSQKEGTF